MLNTSELLPIAVAVVLSMLSGIGVFLMACERAGLKDCARFFTETLIAVTAGLMAFYVGRHQHFDDSIIYFSVLLSSNNGAEVIHMAKRINMDSMGKLLIQLFTRGSK